MKLWEPTRVSQQKEQKLDSDNIPSSMISTKKTVTIDNNCKIEIPLKRASIFSQNNMVILMSTLLLGVHTIDQGNQHLAKDGSR